MQTLDALEAWLETHLPEVAEDLNPGATAAALEQFASALGLRLRADFLQLYRWHDGQQMAINTGPWYGLSFLPLARVQRMCRAPMAR
ncbi:MAG: SMI1/KNR4 family protein [Comamonas sp.]